MVYDVELLLNAPVQIHKPLYFTTLKKSSSLKFRCKRTADSSPHMEKTNILQTIIINCFIIRFGIYGYDALLSVPSASVLFVYVLHILSFVIPIIWIRLQSCRLCIWPDNQSDIVQIIRSVFGDSLANHSSFWIWICHLADCSIFIQFAVLYLHSLIPTITVHISSSTPLHITPSILIGFPLITVMAMMNSCNPSFITLHFFILLFILTSSILFILFGSHHIDLVTLTQYEQSSSLSELTYITAWITWMNSGVLFQSNTPFMFALLFPTSIIMNLAMLVTGLSMQGMSNMSNLTDIALILSGQWFKFVFRTTALLSFISQYHTKSNLATQTLQCFVNNNFRQLLRTKSILNPFGSIQSLLSYGNITFNETTTAKLDINNDESNTIPPPMSRHKRLSHPNTPFSTPPSQKTLLFTKQIMSTPLSPYDIKESDLALLTDPSETSISPRKFDSRFERLSTGTPVQIKKSSISPSKSSPYVLHNQRMNGYVHIGLLRKMCVILNYVVLLVMYTVLDYSLLIQFAALVLNSLSVLVIFSYFRLKWMEKCCFVNVIETILLCIGPCAWCSGCYIIAIGFPYDQRAEIMYFVVVGFGILMQIISRLCCRQHSTNQRSPFVF